MIDTSGTYKVNIMPNFMEKLGEEHGATLAKRNLDKNEYDRRSRYCYSEHILIAGGVQEKVRCMIDRQDKVVYIGLADELPELPKAKPKPHTSKRGKTYR